MPSPEPTREQRSPPASTALPPPVGGRQRARPIVCRREPRIELKGSPVRGLRLGRPARRLERPPEIERDLGRSGRDPCRQRKLPGRLVRMAAKKKQPPEAMP